MCLYIILLKHNGSTGHSMKSILGNLHLNKSNLNKSSLVKNLELFIKHKDIAFAIGILFIIAVLIFPVSTGLLDFLLSASIAFSVLILMTVLFIDKPLDLSSFPSILLIVTMLRLSLNISTTRLILSNGHKGTSAAGHVVEAFGYFVMQGSVMIGLIVFGILTIINFVVITKGSGRIAEVAARFSLDAMPGKQMAIDADVAAGLLNQEEAQQKRKNLESESTFFGSMDGANKFVRGDAIAGLLITFINLIAGIIIGIAQQSMTFEKALKTYTILTIGDGLVTQIPALIVSISAGLLVTKSGVKGSADKAILQQLGKYPQSLAISSCLCFFMGIMPSLPLIPFFIAGSIIGIAAFLLHNSKNLVGANTTKDKKDRSLETYYEDAASNRQNRTIGAHSSFLPIQMIKLELGLHLVKLVEGTDLNPGITEQIRGLRKQLVDDMGFTIPSVSIQDNVQLDNNTYVIKIKEIEVGRGEVKINKVLIIDPKGKNITIPGEDTQEPAFGLEARWIDNIYKEEAMLNGYTIAGPATVIITHMTELIKENIIDLLTYSEVQSMINSLPDAHKKLANDIIPTQISAVTFQRVLQGLLSEGVSIRDLTGILEAVSEISSTQANIQKLIEHVRNRLAKQICHSVTNEEGYIPILVLSAEWEQTFSEYIIGEGDNKQLTMPPSKLHQFVSDTNKEYEKFASSIENPVIVTSAFVRPFIRKIMERVRPNVFIMSQNEIHPKSKIKTLAQIMKND